MLYCQSEVQKNYSEWCSHNCQTNLSSITLNNQLDVPSICCLKKALSIHHIQHHNPSSLPQCDLKLFCVNDWIKRLQLDGALFTTNTIYLPGSFSKYRVQLILKLLYGHVWAFNILLISSVTLRKPHIFIEDLHWEKFQVDKHFLETSSFQLKYQSLYWY